jgi:hypothetical protein
MKIFRIRRKIEIRKSPLFIHIFGLAQLEEHISIRSNYLAFQINNGMAAVNF